MLLYSAVLAHLFANFFMPVLSGLEIRKYGRRDPSRWPRGTLYPKKLALMSPTSDGRSV
jgi:hypothetical protein